MLFVALLARVSLYQILLHLHVYITSLFIHLKLSLQPYFVYECILVPSCLCECEGFACVCTLTAAVSGSRPVAVFEPINNKQ